jgi:hypothetical protein
MALDDEGLGMERKHFAVLSVVAAAAAAGVVFGPGSGLAHADGGCPQDLIQRQARPGDDVCVTRRFEAAVSSENRDAPNNWEPGGGAYGPQTCKQGLVWREAFDGDTVCVTPDMRSTILAQNASAPRAGADKGPVAPPAGDPGDPKPAAPDCFLIFCP